MRRIRYFTALSVTAFAAVAATTSVSSAAVPKGLPETTTGTWSGSSLGATVMEATNKFKVKCMKATVEGTETRSTPPEGSFKFDFKECTGPSNEACTGLGEASGVILTAGSWAGVYDSLTTLGIAFHFKYNPESHFLCGLVLTIVKGDSLCLILNPTVSSTVKEFHCAQSGGVALEKQYWPAAGGEPLETKLEATEMETTTREAGVQMLFEYKFAGGSSFNYDI